MRSRRYPPGTGASIAACTLAAWGLVSCSPTASGRRRPADAGWSDAPDPRAGAGAVAPPRAIERWAVEARLAGLSVAVRRARSEHLGADLEGEVLAPPASGYPPRGPSALVPPGTLVVERLFAGGGATPISYWVMEKQAPGFDARGGDWEYLVVSAAGVVEERGALPLCARCHAEAPADHLFGGRP